MLNCVLELLQFASIIVGSMNRFGAVISVQCNAMVMVMVMLARWK